MRTSALVAAILGLVQAALAIGFLSGSDWMKGVHAGVAYLIVILSVVAAVVAWRWTKAGGPKGTFYHAASLPVLAIVQIGLAEMGAKYVHMAVGVAFFAAAFGLYTMSQRRR